LHYTGKHTRCKEKIKSELIKATKSLQGGNCCFLGIVLWDGTGEIAYFFIIKKAAGGDPAASILDFSGLFFVFLFAAFG
jgi:hypothetical protein